MHYNPTNIANILLHWCLYINIVILLDNKPISSASVTQLHCAIPSIKKDQIWTSIH